MVVKILLVAAGFFLGLLVMAWSMSSKIIGTLRRIRDTTDGQLYFYMEVEQDNIVKIENGRYIMLKVQDDEKIIRFPQK